jgi:hypothetical protein
MINERAKLIAHVCWEFLAVTRYFHRFIFIPRVDKVFSETKGGGTDLQPLNSKEPTENFLLFMPHCSAFRADSTRHTRISLKVARKIHAKDKDNLSLGIGVIEALFIV